MKNFISVITFFLLSGFLTNQAQNKKLIKFDYVECDTIVTFKSNNFGGISGIDYNSKSGEVILTSDRGYYFILKNSESINSMSKKDQKLKSGEIKTNLFKEENIKAEVATDFNFESIRQDTVLGIYYYSIEGDANTSVYYSHGRPNHYNSHVLLKLPLPSDNKGIEALAITPSGALWVAPEAGWEGEIKNKDSIIHFFRYKQPINEYDERQPERFAFKIRRYLKEDTTYRSDSPGGISEIIAIDDSSLLVLERRFNITDKKVEAFLEHYKVIDENGKKNLEWIGTAFDFKFIGTVCNVEGLCWGDKDKKKLIIIADDGIWDTFYNKDNSRPTLKNQVIILKRN